MSAVARTRSELQERDQPERRDADPVLECESKTAAAVSVRADTLKSSVITPASLLSRLVWSCSGFALTAAAPRPRSPAPMRWRPPRACLRIPDLAGR